jgi:hypothetical protein
LEEEKMRETNDDNISKKKEQHRNDGKDGKY